MSKLFFLSFIFFVAAVSATSGSIRINSLFKTYTDLYLNVVPSGKYHGSTSILGQTVTMDIVVESSTTAEIDASGPVSVSCDQEPYTYANGVITLPNSSKSGDCIHDGLAQAGCSISSITYDAASNEIVVKLKYSFVTVSITLHHVDAITPIVPRALAKQQETFIPLSELVDKYYVVFALQDPAGEYKGTKSILGQTVTVDLVFETGNSTLAFTVTGPISVSCSNEAYKYANGVITLPNSSKAGDCIHDALANNGASLKSMTYNTASNSIVVSLKVEFISVDLDLAHV